MRGSLRGQGFSCVREGSAPPPDKSGVVACRRRERLGDRNVTSRRLLLTSVCRPLGVKHGDSESVGYELLYGQVAREQGLFSPRSHHVSFGLEYIAENLETPTTVLQ